MRRQQALRAAAGQQRGMKALVQPVEILGAFAEFIAGALDMAAHLMQRADDAGLPGVVAIDDGEPDGLDLDRGAHAGDVEQILAADVGDAKAALPGAHDQPARHQPRQAFAQRRRADLVALHEVDDAEPRSRRQMTGQDVLLDQRGRALAQRGGLGRRSARLAVGGRHRQSLTSGPASRCRAWIAASSATTSPRSTSRAARASAPARSGSAASP